VYHFDVAGAFPDFSATLEAHSLKVAAGASAELKVAVSRANGYAAPLAVLVTGLPEGVTATSSQVPPKGGPVTVTLSAAATAKPGGWPVRIAAVSPDEDQPAARYATFALDEGQPVRRADSVWLTVSPPAPTTAPTTQKKP
jgi:hypothetical protein